MAALRVTDGDRLVPDVRGKVARRPHRVEHPAGLALADQVRRRALGAQALVVTGRNGVAGLDPRLEVDDLVDAFDRRRALVTESCGAVRPGDNRPSALRDVAVGNGQHARDRDDGAVAPGRAVLDGPAVHTRRGIDLLCLHQATRSVRRRRRIATGSRRRVALGQRWRRGRPAARARIVATAAAAAGNRHGDDEGSAQARHPLHISHATSPVVFILVVGTTTETAPRCRSAGWADSLLGR